MEAVLRLFRKELIQVFRDRKLLFSTLVLPVLLMPVFMFGPSLFLSRLLQGAAERVQEVAVAGLPEEALKALEAARLKPVPVPDPEEAVREGRFPAGVVFREGAYRVFGRLASGLGESQVVVEKVKGALQALKEAQVAEALVRTMLESGLLPEGSLQLLVGSVGDLFDALDHRDSVFFTGSKATADRLRRHPAFLERGALFNAEADSLNPAILGEKATEEELSRLAQEIAQELVIKTGQRCTAIRRVFAPRERLKALLEATRKRLEALRLGDPREEGVDLGPLASLEQKAEVEKAVAALLEAGARVYWRHPGREDGAFFPPTLLLAEDPWPGALHQVEPFGPVATFFPYGSREEAARLAALGGGSLVATLATSDPEEARFYLLALAPYVGRLHLLNARTAASSTGHGSPLPRLLHGGPGRAGGGEELGGLLSVRRHLGRVALQADPWLLSALTGEYAKGAEKPAEVHPFRKAYEDLEVGETLTTHRRTVTEADIALFSALSWDHFYAHTDEIAARESLFGKRVAHGYFVLSAAAGLFVDPAPGPVLANYGLEGLRFLEPVGAGDTLQVRLTVKRKRPRDEKTGVVEWAAEVVNQEGKPVATYTVLTLVARKGALAKGS